MPTDNVSVVFEGLEVSVKVVKMQDDQRSGFDTHMACPDCKSPVKVPTICSNPDCEKHAGLERKETVLYFGSSKDYKAGDTKTYAKAEVESCKELSKKKLSVLGWEEKDFDTRRIQSCHYVIPRPTKDTPDTSAYEILFHSLNKWDKVPVIQMGRTGTEQLGILTVKNNTMVLYTVCHQAQIRAIPEVPAFDETKAEEYAKAGIEFLESLENIDSTTIESQTNKNYEALQKGDIVKVEEEKKERKSESAMDMFKKATKKKQ